MIVSNASRIENKGIEGLLDLFEDRLKIKELYEVNRLKKLDSNSIFVEFFISLDKEKIPKNLEFKLINNDKLQEQILAFWKPLLNDHLLTFDIDSQWETFIDYQTQYSFLNIPELKPFEEILFYSDIFGGLLNLIKANGDRLEYKKESDKIVRFRIVEVP